MAQTSGQASGIFRKFQGPNYQLQLVSNISELSTDFPFMLWSILDVKMIPKNDLLWEVLIHPADHFCEWWMKIPKNYMMVDD